jgi:hypothetical protein
MCPKINNEEGLSTEALSIALLDTKTGKFVNIRDGKDIVFMPKSKAREEQALVVSVDRSSVQMLPRLPATDENEAKTWEQSDPSRVLLLQAARLRPSISPEALYELIQFHSFIVCS